MQCVEVGMGTLTLAACREVLGHRAPSLGDALRPRLCKRHSSVSRPLSPGEARGLSIPVWGQVQRMPGCRLARKYTLLKGGQESHRGCSCRSGSLVPKGNSLAGPGVQDEWVSPEYQQQETKGPSAGRGLTWCRCQMSWCSLCFQEKNSVAFIFGFLGRRVGHYPRRRWWCFWRTCGCYWEGHGLWTDKSPKHPPCSPGKWFSFRSFWKGLLFLEFFPVIFFLLHFASDSQ